MAISDRTQHLFVELLVAPDVMATFFYDGNSPDSNLTVKQRDSLKDELQDLSEELLSSILNIVDTKLTKVQTKVVRAVFVEGRTQVEAAYKFRVHQTSVYKCLFGNMTYVDYQGNRLEKGKEKIYGGAIPKLKKLISLDEHLQAVLKRIAEIRNELIS